MLFLLCSYNFLYRQEYWWWVKSFKEAFILKPPLQVFATYDTDSSLLNQEIPVRKGFLVLLILTVRTIWSSPKTIVSWSGFLIFSCFSTFLLIANKNVICCKNLQKWAFLSSKLILACRKLKKPAKQMSYDSKTKLSVSQIVKTYKQETAHHKMSLDVSCKGALWFIFYSLSLTTNSATLKHHQKRSPSKRETQ